MNFLAVDTSSDYLSVIAVKDGKSYSAFVPDCAMKHSVTLMTKVDEIFAESGLHPESCDFFSATVGAGSFTGIRIGISAIKGLALACGKPALPVTSFDVIAYNSLEPRGKVLCLVDALHGFYYACGYENGVVSYPPAYISESDALALAEKGYALRAIGNLPIAEKTKVETVSPVTGLENAVRAKALQNAFGDLEALYVRKSSAELNLCR